MAPRPEPVAIVDIGSNSGRVMVYLQEAAGQLRILAGSRAPLRLARGLDASGLVPEEALERTFEALRDFRSIARGSGARTIVAAGTSALRDAANGPSFVARVRRELGIEIRLLSGVEEARYGFAGAVGGLPVEDGALFDLGGGSLQVSRFRGRSLQSALSVPLGALRVSDRFLRSDPPTGRELRRLREHVRLTLDRAGVGRLAEGGEVVGTGGTVRNLAR
ncbi:MAG TPA: exopolyphosphatase, partial [Vicinamibacteria bacterium]|nr:exopolyphosphatase [Vicinamibacteria bacterium]